MKKYSLTAILCSLFIVFTSCENPLEELQKQQGIPPGMGYITLSIDLKSERSIIPVIPAPDQYKLIFTDTILPSIQIEKDIPSAQKDDPVSLRVGSYNLVVYAYRAGDHIASSASIPITITAGSNVNMPVPLEALTSGVGTFKWNIGLPAGLETATMYIESLSTGSITPYYGLTSPQSSGTASMSAGYYRVIVNLEKLNAEPITYYEALHIYNNLESSFVISFTDAHFASNEHTVTFDYDYNSITDTQPVIHGGFAVPVPPSERSFSPVVAGLYLGAPPSYWEFDYWYKDNELVPFDFVSTQIVGDITLKARWKDPFITNNVVNAIDHVAAAGAGSYYLLVNTTETITSSKTLTGVDLTICGLNQSSTLQNGAAGELFIISGGSSVTLGATGYQNITLKGTVSSTSLIRVETGGTLTMNSGSKITGHTNSSGTGAVFVNGTFNMNGGEISGNTNASGPGGIAGLYVPGASAEFKMNGGSISSNTGPGSTRADAYSSVKVNLSNTANIGSLTLGLDDGSVDLNNWSGIVVYLNLKGNDINEWRGGKQIISGTNLTAQDIDRFYIVQFLDSTNAVSPAGIRNTDPNIGQLAP